MDLYINNHENLILTEVHHTYKAAFIILSDIRMDLVSFIYLARISLNVLSSDASSSKYWASFALCINYHVRAYVSATQIILLTSKTSKHEINVLTADCRGGNTPALWCKTRSAVLSQDHVLLGVGEEEREREFDGLRAGGTRG